MNNCLFCAIAKGEIPSFKIYEDELVFSFLDINPMSRAHTLVIPKMHAANLLEASDEMVSEIMKRVRKIASHISKVLPCDGFNILQNNGEAAGQTIHHLHFHIIPRYKNDALTFSPQPANMDELKELAARLNLSL